MVILATWEDPSTPFHFGRDDISVGDAIQPHRLYSGRGRRQIAAPTDTPVGGTIHLHGLYSLRCMAMNHRRYIAWFHSSGQVIFATWRAARLPPLHCVVPFNLTGYIHNVAGGRFAAPTFMYHVFLHNLFMGCGIFLWMGPGFSKALKIYGLFCSFIRCVLLHDVGFLLFRSRIFSTFCERAVEKNGQGRGGVWKEEQGPFPKSSRKRALFFQKRVCFSVFPPIPTVFHNSYPQLWIQLWITLQICGIGV